MNNPMSFSQSLSIRRYEWLLWVIVAGVVISHAFLFYYGHTFIDMSGSQADELALALALVVLTSASLIIGASASWLTRQISRQTGELLERELARLQANQQRSQALQGMASTLRATLSFERVVAAALDVCSQALEELGIAGSSVVGAVFLFRGEQLRPIAHRHFLKMDESQTLTGKSGVVGQALELADPQVTHHPEQDSELEQFATLRMCRTVVCIPLRAGFQIYGLLLLGTKLPAAVEREQLDFFNSVADQAVIALQNAQLYQELEAEKDRIIAADEEARIKLARDLHDGPTQDVATIAMRLNFVRALLPKEPLRAREELAKLEVLARETSSAIRGMLFTLRPLVLETQGLAAAIEMALGRLAEHDGLATRLVGAENGDLLDERAQGVVFYIIEEALGNARKHAAASLVEVNLWQERDLFVARIQDDGVGFDTAMVAEAYTTRGSLGMVNMEERAALIDGSLNLESKPGGGTSITLVVPLSKHGRRRGGAGRMNGEGG